jgi:hypothetical protein
MCFSHEQSNLFLKAAGAVPIKVCFKVLELDTTICYSEWLFHRF